MTSLLIFILIIVLILLIHRFNGLKRRIDLLEQHLFPTKSHPVSPPVNQAPQAATPSSQPSAPMKPKRPSRTRAEWEALVGGKILNRIGALAIIIGAGFFLKYSFDNNWISESLRVLIGAIAGFAFLFAAMHYQKKNLPIFAQGLAGTGLSILYLSIYASFNFYHLLPQLTAFVLMAVVTGLALALALYFDALAVSVLAWAGGYLTPFMLNTGQANETGLFSYILLLQGSLLLVAVRKKNWTILPLLTVAATYVLFFAWFGQDYTNSDLQVGSLFLTLFWAIFFVYEQYDLLATSKTMHPFKMLAALLNVCCYFASLYMMFYPDYFDESAYAALGLSVVYGFAMLNLSRKNAKLVPVIRQQTIIAIILLAIATAIHFSKFMVVTVWAIEGALLMYAGVRWQKSYIRSGAVALLLVSGFAILWHRSGLAYHPIESFRLLFTTRFLAYFTLSAALAFSAFLLRRHDAAGFADLIKWLGFGFCTTVFFMLTVETLDVFEKALSVLRKGNLDSATLNQIQRLKNIQQLSLSGVWLLYSVALLAAGIWRRIAGWRMAAIVLFGISILKVFIYDLSFLDTLYRIISFVTLGLILLAVSFFYQKYKEALFPK